MSETTVFLVLGVLACGGFALSRLGSDLDFMRPHRLVRSLVAVVILGAAAVMVAGLIRPQQVPPSGVFTTTQSAP
jgi:hypothetical protein